MNSAAMIWPNFFVVGAPKCGTTSLRAHLKSHPQVYLPKAKEPSYFLRNAPGGVTFEEYKLLYESARGYAAIGDVSPFYLWDQDAPNLIYEICPMAKIIVMVRDPLIRAHSHYLMYQRLEVEPEPSFYKALQRYHDRSARNWSASRDYIEAGMYWSQVRRYREVFGQNQVLVLLSDDLSRDPQRLLAGVASHIGVDPALLDMENASEVHNSFRTPRFPGVYHLLGSSGLKAALLKYSPGPLQNWMRYSPLLYEAKRPPLDDQSRTFLQNIYDPDIKRLEELLGRSLPELRKSWV